MASRTASKATAYKAVILSAGQGSRLLPHTEQIPKCLLSLNGRSMLEWQLHGLAEAGVREAVVVTGFRDDLVQREIEHRTPRPMRVRTLFNPISASRSARKAGCRCSWSGGRRVH